MSHEPLVHAASKSSPAVSGDRRARVPKYAVGPVRPRHPCALPLSTLVPMKQSSAAAAGRRRVPAVARTLLGRQRFAGQRRLVDEQVLGREQPGVGGHHVSGRQVDDVTRHERNRQLRPLRILDRCDGLSGFAAAPSPCLRRTAAVVWTIARAVSAARFERYSRMNPSETLSTTIVAMIDAASRSPINAICRRAAAGGS